MDGLARCTSDCTHRKALGCFFGTAIIASCDPLLDNLYLPIESRSAALHERNIRSQAHLVDMSSCFQIVQRVEDHREAPKPADVELGILDVGMVSHQLHIRIEGMRRLLCYLQTMCQSNLL